MIFSNAKNNKKFLNKKILAIDYGEKFTGLAKFYVGHDPFPYPYGRIPVESKEKLLNDIQKIVSEEDIDVLLLGIPTLLDGKETKMTKKIQQFGETLQDFIQPLPLYYQDETLSTFEAQDRMKNSPRYNFKVQLKEIDALSATIILEDFLKESANTFNT